MLTSQLSKSKAITKNPGQRSYVTNIPLTDFIPQFDYQGTVGTLVAPTLKTSTLKNGLKVVTAEGNHPTSSLGLFINSGSRFEDPSNAGASFFLRHMAFKSTKNLSSLRFIRNIELANATFDVAVGREYMAFTSDVPTQNAQTMVALLSEGFHPALVHWEVRDEVEKVHKAAQEIEKDPRAITFELLHQEAYRNKGLGQSLHAPLYNIHHLNDGVLKHFVNRTYHPEGSVFVATGGVKHAEVIAMLERAMPTFGANERPNVAAEYVGGDARLAGDFDTHLALGFQGVRTSSSEYIALATLQCLLGNGANVGNYALGGGRGGRLNLKLVAPSSYIHEASAFNFNYSDSGLFGVFAVAKRGHVARLVDGVTRELAALTNASSITAEELNRAKALLKSQTYGNDSRLALLEHLAKQSLGKANVALPSELASAIDAVTADSVAAVAKKVFSSKPTIAILGDVENTPSLEKIQASFK